jgi:cytochrome P450
LIPHEGGGYGNEREGPMPVFTKEPARTRFSTRNDIRAGDRADGGPRPFRKLPHPGGWPILGQLPGFDASRTHLVLEDWARRFGTPYRFSMGPGFDAMVIDDPDTIQQISRQRPEAFTRGGRLRPVMAEMGFDGVFSAEGEAWAIQRRLVMGALNATHLTGWLPALSTITARLAQRWTAAAAIGKPVEMTAELKRYSVDVTSLLAFGRDPMTLAADHDDRIQTHLELIFPAIMRRVMTPFSYWHWVKLPADRRLDRAVAAVHGYARACIQKARSELGEADNAPPRHALDAMLRNQKALGLTEADILANVVTLLLGGEDTTAHALCWTLFYLAQDPDLQDSMAGRAREILRDSDTVHAAGLAALELFEHLALEAIRLRPVVPFNVFEPVADAVVGGVAVPARTKIFTLARPAMLDPARFVGPLDFRPGRWAAGAPSGSIQHRAYLPFGAGARVCPGRALATAEMRLVLAMVLGRFRLELACAPTEIAEVNALTMMPDRMPIRLIAR